MASNVNAFELAAEQRRNNARSTTLVVAVLYLLVLYPGWRLGASAAVVGSMAATAVVSGIVYGWLRRGSVALGMLVVVTAIFAQHVVCAACNATLHPIPYLAAIPILLAAPTLTSGWLWIVPVQASLALGLEALARPLTQDDLISMLTGTVLMLVTFVVSLLHVRSTERALQVASERERERALAAAAAVESEERYRLIADHTDDLFGLLGPDGLPVYLSPSYQRLLGHSLATMMKQTVQQWVVPDGQDSLGRAFDDAVKLGESRTEAIMVGANGSALTFDLKLTRVNSKDGILIAVAGRDITERKQFERRLFASERMESLGRLAGSVAHDFNNLLMVIGGGAEMARMAIRDNQDLAEDLDSVLEATRSASKLTRQLLTFSRKQVVSPTELDLGEALEKIRELLERLVGKKVTVAFEFEPGCPKVVMATAHLEQLAMNLTINARDAMATGGQLTFGVRSRLLDASSVTQSLAPGQYVELSVRDQGCGIPDDIRGHIFEPLFTTKGDSGTGLGLATCQSIATQWHGTISVESELGRGSTFRVLLPASTQPAQAPARPSPFPGAVRRVLVVDDEPAPRETAARLLRSSGFEVIVASNLQEARQHIGDPGLILDALLTDVVLSGELGTDLLEDCRARRPNARIVVMSGYAPNPSANGKFAAVSARFLPKPFTREELLRALREESH